MNKPDVRVMCPNCRGISFKVPVGEYAVCELCKYRWLPENAFTKDWFFNQKMQEYANLIYRSMWNISGIQRNLGELDKERGIDIKLTLESGLTIDIQEKFRRNHYIKFWQFTIEYKNDPRKNEPGEFYKLAANYYFYSYSNIKENGFKYWWLIDLNRFKNSYNDGILMNDDILQNGEHGKANALCFDFNNQYLKDCYFRDSQHIKPIQGELWDSANSQSPTK